MVEIRKKTLINETFFIFRLQFQKSALLYRGYEVISKIFKNA